MRTILLPPLRPCGGVQDKVVALGALGDILAGALDDVVSADRPDPIDIPGAGLTPGSGSATGAR
jgi:hypothetical protein